MSLWWILKHTWGKSILQLSHQVHVIYWLVGVMLRTKFGWSWTGLLEKKKYDKAGMINTPKQEELNIFILFMPHPINTNKEREMKRGRMSWSYLRIEVLGWCWCFWDSWKWKGSVGYNSPFGCYSVKNCHVSGCCSLNQPQPAWTHLTAAAESI